MASLLVVRQESIISMLIKLHEQYLGASEKFSLPAELPLDFDRRVEVPSGANITKQILMMAAARSRENLEVCRAVSAMNLRIIFLIKRQSLINLCVSIGTTTSA